MSFKDSLKSRPAIYEIVPPRQDTSRYVTELQGVDEVLADRRIAAINIPELINRRKGEGGTVYSPATFPPEEYAMMIRDRKETIVNMVAPRLEKEEFVRRARRAVAEYGINNLVLVGKERGEDVLPGPSVLEALALLSAERTEGVALGGICIFGRTTSEGAGRGRKRVALTESKRVWLKAREGCDFVTSQITFESGPALEFLALYQSLCEQERTEPLTVFVSLTTVPSQSILSLLKRLDVKIPLSVRKRLEGSQNMGEESLRISAEVFRAVVQGAEDAGITVPLGLQVEQVGVNSDELSLRLLDMTYPILRGS